MTRMQAARIHTPLVSIDWYGGGAADYDIAGVEGDMVEVVQDALRTLSDVDTVDVLPDGEVLCDVADADTVRRLLASDEWRDHMDAIMQDRLPQVAEWRLVVQTEAPWYDLTVARVRALARLTEAALDVLVDGHLSAAVRIFDDDVPPMDAGDDEVLAYVGDGSLWVCYGPTSDTGVIREVSLADTGVGEDVRHLVATAVRVAARAREEGWS